MVYTDPDDVPWSAYLALAAIFTVLVGALLPWFVDGGASTTGWERQDGKLTAGVSLATLGLLVAYEWRIVAQLGGALAGILTLWAGYRSWSLVDSSSAQAEIGLYLTLVGGALLLCVAVYGSVETYLLSGDSDGGILNAIRE